MKKVLIISAHIGEGHVKAAQAIHDALLKHGDVEVRTIEMLGLSSWFINLWYRQIYLKVVKALPEAYAWFYRKSGMAKHLAKPRTLLHKIHLKKFLAEVRAYAPDVVICTSQFPALMLSFYGSHINPAKGDGVKKKFKLATIITDYEFHPSWHAKDVDLYFVATEEVKFELEYFGVPSEKVVVSGLPVLKSFEATTDKPTLLNKYGLSDESPVILLTVGSFHNMPIDKVLDGFSEIKQNFQLMIVAGKNKKVFDEIQKNAEDEPRIKRVFGFVDFMDELMGVSDLIITKPGGMTVTECLAKNLPMLLIENHSGQEEANADYLVKNGAAVKCRSLASLIFMASGLLKNPEKIKTMSEAAKNISRPGVAEIIAEHAINLAH